MGKPNPKYHKTLFEQMRDVLVSKQRFGVSRAFLKRNGLDKDAISSVNTYRTYLKWASYFAIFVETFHPEVTTMRKAKKYIREYLEMRMLLYNEGKLSAATIKTETSALNKIFGIGPDDPEYFKPPKMDRADIKRSRNVIPGSGNEELDNFGRGTGLRTHKELEVLHGEDYITYEEIRIEYDTLSKKKSSGEPMTRDEHDHLAAASAALQFADKEHFVVVRNGKGGKRRYAPVVGDHVDEIVTKIKNTPDGQRVFANVPHSVFASMNEHALRAEYAAIIYHEYASPIEDLPKDCINEGTGHSYASRLYSCRGSFAGRKYDKVGLLRVSAALGHGDKRLYDVVAHYSYRF